MNTSSDKSYFRFHRGVTYGSTIALVLVVITTFYLQLNANIRRPLFAGVVNTCHPLVVPSSNATLRPSAYKDFTPATLASTKSKYAYISILSLDRGKEYDEDINKDNNFVATRLQAFQLLHAKETRSQGIPYIVMTVPGIPEREKQRLRMDGAIVHEIDHLPLPDWIRPEPGRWSDMFDKLRVLELTQFERVLFLDADIVLTAPLDGIFEETALQEALPEKMGNSDKSKRHLWSPARDDDVSREPLPPKNYVFAATHELTYEHKFPPSEATDFYHGDSTYLNAGFIVLRPSMQMFDYYNAMLAREGTFSYFYMEQDFLNFVHRPDGPLPWKEIDPIWNVHFPSQADVDAGVRSLHSKWWQPVHGGLSEYLKSWKFKMDGYFEAWDNLFLH